MNQEMKAWIDHAEYQQLLERWRFAPLGDPMFQGEIGEHFQQVMKAKRAALEAGDPEVHARTSKRVGWRNE